MERRVDHADGPLGGPDPEIIGEPGGQAGQLLEGQTLISAKGRQNHAANTGQAAVRGEEQPAAETEGIASDGRWQFAPIPAQIRWETIHVLAAEAAVFEERHPTRPGEVERFAMRDEALDFEGGFVGGERVGDAIGPDEQALACGEVSLALEEGEIGEAFAREFLPLGDISAEQAGAGESPGGFAIGDEAMDGGIDGGDGAEAVVEQLVKAFAAAGEDTALDGNHGRQGFAIGEATTDLLEVNGVENCGGRWGSGLSRGELVGEGRCHERNEPMDELHPVANGERDVERHRGKQSGRSGPRRDRNESSAPG